jgi:hypothetical protein
MIASLSPYIIIIIIIIVIIIFFFVSYSPLLQQSLYDL